MQETLLFTRVCNAEPLTQPREPRGPEKMNLDAIYRLIEETQIFGLQQPSVKPPGDAVAPASGPRDTCDSRWPLHGPQCHAAHSSWARCSDTSEWDICEELRLRELEEVKARAAQMEKTMRWWSDCTATWREKWGQVRAERNSAREEGRQLRMKLEMAVKELSALRKQPRAPQHRAALEAGGARAQACPRVTDTPCAPGDPFPAGSHPRESGRERLGDRDFPAETSDSSEGGLVLDPLRLNEEERPPLGCPDALENGGSESCPGEPGLGQAGPEAAALRGRLHALQTVLRRERRTRSSLEKEIERLEAAVSSWKQKYEELRDWPAAGRTELERLQAEGAAEWDQRAMLDTEKQGLERENRRLQGQGRETDDLLKRREALSANPQGPGFKTSQDELQEKSKELLDLQQAYRRLRGHHQAKSAELTLATHRAAQSAAEVTHLRLRMGDLKQRLVQKEGQLDDVLNQIRKLQRSLDEQKEANENLEAELRHLQNR
ncbi:PREDICTED: coiled-coil domain-containing protein 102B [Miniopterus natalensis]|uniref:coiled-coil domain-containing protein 102B n=1 Tax=Miniopterus natalensis TaxID=291302 RepID=UPI0007A6AD0A|nr:PREDICTED: coiled-coil domain-containing protein 102B [Miniopterus natalensis]